MNVLYTTTIVLVALWLVVITIVIYKKIRKRNDYNTTISFKETLDLVEVPVATFKFKDNNDKLFKMSFVIDTGASTSFISKDSIDRIGKKYKDFFEFKEEICSANKSVSGSEAYSVRFFYDNSVFITNFTVMDINSIIDYIKREYGITISGVIGSEFFNKESADIDFKYYKLKLNGKRNDS